MYSNGLARYPSPWHCPWPWYLPSRICLRPRLVLVLQTPLFQGSPWSYGRKDKCGTFPRVSLGEVFSGGVIVMSLAIRVVESEDFLGFLPTPTPAALKNRLLPTPTPAVLKNRLQLRSSIFENPTPTPDSDSSKFEKTIRLPTPTPVKTCDSTDSDSRLRLHNPSCHICLLLATYS